MLLPFAYRKEFRLLRPYYILSLVMIVAGYSVYYFTQPETAITLATDRHLIEWLTFSFLALAGLLFITSFIRIRNIYFLLLAVIMFFTAGKELGWGKKVSATLATSSVQTHTNTTASLANSLILLEGRKFGRAAVNTIPKMDLLFKMFLFAFGIILPLAVWHLYPARRMAQGLRLPIPPLSIGIFFLIGWIGQQTVLCFVKEPLAANNIYYSAMLNAAGRYFELMISAVLLCMSIFFFKSPYGNVIGKDIKQLITRK